MYAPVKKGAHTKKILIGIGIAVVAFAAVFTAFRIADNLSDRRLRAELVEDLDYMLAVLEENFPHINTIYRLQGVDIFALGDNIREQVLDRGNPMSHDIFRELLLTDFLRPTRFIGHLQLSSWRPYTPCAGTNLVTEIIEEGRIAHLRVISMSACSASYCRTCNLIALDFYRQIIDFDHLIIDIRGNPGGFVEYFHANIARPLIADTRLSTTFTHFFKAGEYNINFLRQQIPGHFSRRQPVSLEAIDRLFGLENLEDWVIEDLMSMDYYFMTIKSVSSTPTLIGGEEWGRWRNFDGKIWTLIDGGVSSASQEITAFYMNTGFATFVGEPTRGIAGLGGFQRLLTAGQGLTMPNTGIRVRFDSTYMVDAAGHPNEYPINPHYFNRPGMDALQTVLAMIEEGHTRAHKFAGNNVKYIERKVLTI